MNSLFFIPITFLLGILLGNLYFRGLWMTVQKISTVPNPILLTFSSFLVRLAIAISGFYFVLMIAKEYAIFNLTICLLAFMGIRNYLIKKSLLIIPRIVNEYQPRSNSLWAVGICHHQCNCTTILLSSKRFQLKLFIEPIKNDAIQYK